MIKCKRGRGEGGSAYWNWVKNHQRHEQLDDHDVWEPVEANPDQSSYLMFEQRDGDSFKEYTLNNSLAKKIESICTQREKDVIKLLQKGYNQTEIAHKLRVPIGSINTLVSRIRYKAVNVVYRKPKYGDIVRTRKLS